MPLPFVIGSDLAGVRTSAVRSGDDYIVNGSKIFITNAGPADVLITYAATDRTLGPKGISAFIVDADTPGLEIAARIDVVAPHPLATLEFDGCRIPAGQQLGKTGDGFKLAMRTLDIFRASVAGAALGFFLPRLADEAGKVQEHRFAEVGVIQRDEVGFVPVLIALYLHAEGVLGGDIVFRIGFADIRNKACIGEIIRHNQYP